MHHSKKSKKQRAQYWGQKKCLHKKPLYTVACDPDFIEEIHRGIIYRYRVYILYIYRERERVTPAQKVECFQDTGKLCVCGSFFFVMLIVG